MAALEQCRAELGRADATVRAQREELQQAQAELSERDLVFVTLQGAVENERKREAALTARLAEVEREHASLAAALKQGGRRAPASASPVTVLHGAATTTTTSPHRTAHRVDAGPREGEAPGPRTAAARRANAGGPRRPAAPANAQPSLDESVDIFGGRRH